MKRIEPLLPRQGRSWTSSEPLPGGDFPVRGFDGLVASLTRSHPGLPAVLVRRLARAYGTRVRGMLSGVDRLEDMGQSFGAGLTEREVAYLVEREWARTADDILWRRSKLGLRLGAEERQRLADWLAANGERLNANAA